MLGLFLEERQADVWEEAGGQVGERKGEGESHRRRENGGTGIPEVLTNAPGPKAASPLCLPQMSGNRAELFLGPRGGA